MFHQPFVQVGAGAALWLRRLAGFNGDSLRAHIQCVGRDVMQVLDFGEVNGRLGVLDALT